MANNPLFNALGGRQMNPMANLVAEAKRLQQTLQGNPKDEVQKMLNDGRLSQAQFNQYAQMATQIMSAMGGKL